MDIAEPLQPWPIEPSIIVELSPGKFHAGHDNNAIRLWDVKRRAEIFGFAPNSSVKSLAVLPDGRLACAGEYTSTQLWDVKRGIETARLEGHSNQVIALAVLPNGRLASGSEDKTIRLWDVKRGAEAAKEIARLEIDAIVFCLIALSDGRLVAGDQLGRLHWLEIVG